MHSRPPILSPQEDLQPRRVSGSKNPEERQPWSAEGIDAVLTGPYRVAALVGEGALSYVYRAHQTEMDCPVAIKVIPKDSLLDDSGYLDRFHSDFPRVAKLRHPCIVPVLDFGETSDFLYVVYQFIDGVSLREVIDDHGALLPNQIFTLVELVNDALEYAHGEGVIHRNLKPSNILIDREGCIRVSDFGLARHNVTSAMEGSPHVAPELLDSNAETDHRVDIHALGVILYEVLVGKVSAGEDLVLPSGLRADIAPQIDGIVARATAPNPDDRYPGADEFRSEVRVLREPSDALLSAQGAEPQDVEKVSPRPSVEMGSGLVEDPTRVAPGRDHELRSARTYQPENQDQSATIEETAETAGTEMDRAKVATTSESADHTVIARRRIDSGSKAKSGIETTSSPLSPELGEHSNESEEVDRSDRDEWASADSYEKKPKFFLLSPTGIFSCLALVAAGLGAALWLLNRKPNLVARTVPTPNPETAVESSAGSSNPGGTVLGAEEDKAILARLPSDGEPGEAALAVVGGSNSKLVSPNAGAAELPKAIPYTGPDPEREEIEIVSSAGASPQTISDTESPASTPLLPAKSQPSEPTRTPDPEATATEPPEAGKPKASDGMEAFTSASWWKTYSLVAEEKARFAEWHSENLEALVSPYLSAVRSLHQQKKAAGDIRTTKVIDLEIKRLEAGLSIEHAHDPLPGTGSEIPELARFHNIFVLQATPQVGDYRAGVDELSEGVAPAFEVEREKVIKTGDPKALEDFELAMKRLFPPKKAE